MSKDATSTDEKDEAAKVATAESEDSEAAEDTETPEVSEDSADESGEDFRAKYEAQREHSRTWEARAKANEKKLEKEIQKNQDLTNEVDSLKTEIANKDREVLVAKVSAEEGVRPQFLSGETEEELRDSAKVFLSEYRPVRAILVGMSDRTVVRMIRRPTPLRVPLSVRLVTRFNSQLRR